LVALEILLYCLSALLVHSACLFTVLPRLTPSTNFLLFTLWISPLTMRINQKMWRHARPEINANYMFCIA